MSKILREGNVEKGYGSSGLILDSGEGSIFSISRDKSTGKFYLCEECDSFYCKSFTKEEVLQILEELKDYVNS